MLWCTVALLALCASAQGRAVNISNTWVLPEEGFPVFYRYFRDRISWYEADAVCQFHHANLVTVDTTAQYDAVRAYLKELDISSAVWVGLIRSNPDGDFTWTVIYDYVISDYRGLGGDGYWSSAPDARSAPLCAAADPAADYRWEARACGGPTVASFICELPVPQWALGNEGCMVRALPALTILYLPESAAVQLTADCGLAGVKRVQCTGNVKREELLRDLRCPEEEDTTSTFSPSSVSNTWPLTTDATFTDQETTTEITTEENVTTEHEDDINQSMTASPYHDPSSVIGNKLPMKVLSRNTFVKIINKKVDLGLTDKNNLHSNSIPKLANDNYLTNEQLEKIEDEKHMQHKMLHEEIARLGNLETIFTQPTDHFVPPLVMAKAKISDDMTVLSLQEKHAQQLAEQHFSEFAKQYGQNDHLGNTVKSTTEEPKIITSNKPPADAIQPIRLVKENFRKDKIKSSMPKKYNEKFYDPKSKSLKVTESKSAYENTQLLFTHSQNLDKVSTTTPSAVDKDKYDDDSSIDITVILKDEPKEHSFITNYTGDISKLEVIKSNTSSNDTEIKLLDIGATEEPKLETIKSIDEKSQNITSTHKVVRITIISDDQTNSTPTVFEITTKMPIFEENDPHDLLTTSYKEKATEEVKNHSEPVTTDVNLGTTQAYFETTPVVNTSTTTIATDPKDNDTKVSTNSSEQTDTTINEIILTTTFSTLDYKNITGTPNKQHRDVITTTDVPLSTSKEIDDIHSTVNHEEYGINNSSEIDDFQSPLLSGANEPLHRPNRSRRPQPPPNRNKFNPFRILG